MQNITMQKFLAIIAMLIPSLAFAHTGHIGHSHTTLLAGFLHPLTGLDHLAAMLAVGLWAATFNDAKRWQIPLTFVGIMTLGFVLGLNGLQVPQLEAGIAASVMVLGVLLATTRNIASTIALPLVALFALLHGVAHGAESTGTEAIGTALLFALGFISTTLALHGVGFYLATRFNAQAGLIRATGVLFSAFGLYLLVAA